MLTAHVAHQALVCGFFSCAIALKSDFAAAKVGRSHQTKPKIHLQDESSRREGCREGEEGADGKRNSNCLQTPAPADGISSETPLSEGSRGREGTVRTDDVAPKRRKKKDRGKEHNSSFTCCYNFFFFKLCISSVIMDRMCLYIDVCSGIGADTW